MIPLHSTTIRRREMDAVLTCMVDEKIGPGEMNERLVQGVKDFFMRQTLCGGKEGAGDAADAKKRKTLSSIIAGAAALRSPAIALRYALDALGLKAGAQVMISALSPAWVMIELERRGYKPLVLDVDGDSGLLTPDAADAGMKAGGAVLLLHETLGLIPDMDDFASLGLPIIEDISSSIGGSTLCAGDDGDGGRQARLAGTFGTYSILGLEEHDAVTAGGGAVLLAPHRREWSVLKQFIDASPSTDLLPDLNSALAVAELKEFAKNEDRRREIYQLYQRAILNTGNRAFPRDTEAGDAASCFPLVLLHSYMDAKQYAQKKEVEIKRAFEGSVISFRGEELSPSCMNAKQLFLSTVLVPLYARLTASQAEKVVKVLMSMP